MGLWLIGAFLIAAALWLIVRWFVTIDPRNLARGLKSFIAGFSALAGTGLLLTGRLGLAVVVVAAAVMAVRAMRGGEATAAPGGKVSTVETVLLTMRLDRRTGAVEGEVKSGAQRGRSLAALGLPDLRRLLAEARRVDPPSVALLEAYLDRRYPDWRTGAHADEGGGAREAATMDAATACAILGVKPAAGPEEIRLAYRRLMAKLHPDHGGSDYLASQLNRARDVLLRDRPAG